MADASVRSNIDNEIIRSPTLLSCLRSARSLPRQLNARSVSFPEDESNIVTGYLDPPNPWEHAESVNKESVILQYKKSCERHGTRPISGVLKQIQGYDLSNGERMKLLNLKGEPLSTATCEPLEEVLKRIQLLKIDLESTSLDDESSVVMFDMIEYYEAAIHLNISYNHGIGGRGWQACSRMLKRAKCLELLECRGTPLTEQYMTILCRALRIGTQLQILKLDNCQLTGRPMVTLVAALKLNTVLKELHLGENGLNIHDALQLGALLKQNNTLQLLDVSNNCLEDIGLSHLLDGLWEQRALTGHGPGLNMLVLWNNNISHESSDKIARTIVTVKSLEVLNIGSNRVGNQLLEVCRDGLTDSKSLLRLGMQSTQLTCAGAIILALIITENNSLQRIDIRDNNIHVEGLDAINTAMKSNKCLNRLDIDGPSLKTNLSDEDLDKYTELWDDVRTRCHENEANEKEQEALERLKVGMRKISLTCNTLKLGMDSPDLPRASRLTPLAPPHSTRLRSPAPSPIPSPVTSPSPIRTRFQVSRVSEEESSSIESVVVPTPPVSPPSQPTSRFRVTVIDAAPSRAPSSATPADKAQGMVSRASRKLTAWVNPAQLLTESKTVEKILGLFPWSRGSQQDLLNNNSGGGGGSGGGTWPPQQASQQASGTPPQSASQHSASTPSLVHTS